MDSWTYQPPHRPADYPDQCYYRSAGHRLSVHVDGAPYEAPRVQVYRHTDDTNARLSLRLTSGHGECTVEAWLDAPTLRALRAALSDALHDIAEVEADRERQESFDRIAEEMRDADELGGPAVYYGHPDIHYVPADQVEAKVRELEAAGVKRYMVLPHPAAGAEGEQS